MSKSSFETLISNTQNANNNSNNNNNNATADIEQHREEVAQRKFKGKAYRVGHTLGDGPSVPVASTLLPDYVDVNVRLYKNVVYIENTPPILLKVPAVLWDASRIPQSK
eukprot:PhM_4_TR17368/c2_g2_i2/m.34305